MSHFRSAQPSDALPLSRLAEETFRATFAAENSEEDMELHCRRNYGISIQRAEIIDPGMVTLLCAEGERMLGFVQLCWGIPPEDVTGHHPGEIRRLYVVKDAHGTGVAQGLVSTGLDALRERGSDMAWLGVWEQNPRAIAFYRKCGFTEAGSHIFTLGNDPQRDIIMVRSLRS